MSDHARYDTSDGEGDAYAAFAMPQGAVGFGLLGPPGGLGQEPPGQGASPDYGLLSAPSASNYGGLFSATPGAAARPAGGSAWPPSTSIASATQGVPDPLSGLQGAPAPDQPPYLPGRAPTGASAIPPGPLLGPKPPLQGAADQRALQLMTQQADDPNVRYDPSSGGLAWAGTGAALSPDQTAIFKERALNSASYAPGLKSPEEQALDWSMGQGPSTTSRTSGGQIAAPPVYVPRPGDENLLARIIFAESGAVPGDAPAVGWTAVNRTGSREFGDGSLSGVAYHPKAYQSIDENSPQWRLSSDPSRMTGPDVAAWRNAQTVARGVLSGQVPDPTGGAVYHFSSPSFTGDPSTAPKGFFRTGLTTGTLAPSGYRSTAQGPNKNYFIVETPRRKP